MFGKALVLAAWGGITAAYAAWKIRRARKGITLRYDPKRDLHYDPLDKWEGRGRKLRTGIDILGAIMITAGMAVAIYSLFTR